jgi:hypothetical protein
MRYLITIENLTGILKKVPDMKNNFQSIIHTLARELFDSYDSFKLATITSNRFTQAEMLAWLQPFENQNLLSKKALGTSCEGRTISLYTIGDGPTTVMLWSQMHGDEPTATMALIDILNFFVKNPGHTITKTICKKLTLLMIPMLNPDGAERWTRRTAQMIDMNRDALALVTPEARILKETRDKYQPEYGFNLHDQDPQLTVGSTKKITAIALLAPSINESRTDNPVRIKAKKTASMFAQILHQFIPGYIAKWDDTFEPRAFGDNIQKWGTSTVLVESGGWHGDPNKFFIRKLNYVGLLTTLYAIALGENNSADVGIYERIPFNTKLGCDYIIRNATLKVDDKIAPSHVDIGINFNECINASSGQLDNYAKIVEIGDLNAFTALETEVDANGAELLADKIKLDCSFPANEVGLLLKQV